VNYLLAAGLVLDNDNLRHCLDAPPVSAPPRMSKLDFQAQDARFSHSGNDKVSECRIPVNRLLPPKWFLIVFDNDDVSDRVDSITVYASSEEDREIALVRPHIYYYGSTRKTMLTECARV
jgi:hypothetical protein